MYIPRFLRPSLALLYVCLVAGLCIPSLASDRADRLTAMMETHRHKAQGVRAGTDTTDAAHFGTAFNEIGAKEYTCASLAFLFGKDDIFQRLGTIEELPRKVLGDSQLHENWAIAAKHVLGMSERDRIETWNLDCVRQHDIGKEHYLASLGAKAGFTVREDQMHVLGDIEPGFHERFRVFLAQNPQVKSVALGSGGGSLQDAILTGLLIRTKGLDTALRSDCYSACPLIFLGGVNRLVWSPYPRLGFHQISEKGDALPPGHEAYEVVRKYAEAMGADSAFLLSQIHSAPPADMSYPDVWDLCEPQITTWVQRGC